jgi:hypothetical protein
VLSRLEILGKTLHKGVESIIKITYTFSWLPLTMVEFIAKGYAIFSFRKYLDENISKGILVCDYPC